MCVSSGKIDKRFLKGLKHFVLILFSARVDDLFNDADV